jgi:hypothetical protein
MMKLNLTTDQFKLVRAELRKAEPEWLSTFKMEREDVHTLLDLIDTMAGWDESVDDGGVAEEKLKALEAKLSARGEEGPKLDKVFGALVKRVQAAMREEAEARAAQRRQQGQGGPPGG